jgi:predicted Zn-dependent peptidase
MKKVLFALSMGASLMAVAQKPTPKAAPKPTAKPVAAAVAPAGQVKYTEYDLPNGLHVILHEDHATPIVAVSIMYHVGSKNEDTARTGFAHFFEHLLFEGSKNIKRGEFDKYIEGSGGMNNANTSWDRTYYYEVLPSNQLELGLWLESERLMHAKVEKIGVETQRQVVKEERRQRIDNQPYGSVIEELMKRLYTVHPYRWPIIGSMAHLDAAEEQDYVNFYKTFYVPNNACLSIAGDINVAQTKALIEKYFAAIPKGTKAIQRPNVAEPALRGETVANIPDNIQIPAVIMGYHGPKQGSADYYALQMLAQLLSGGESSRLTKSLVDKQEVALQISAFPLSLEDSGPIVFFGLCNEGTSPEKLKLKIDEEIEKVKNELISEEELQKLKNAKESEFVSSKATVAGVAEELAQYHMFFGNAALINSEVQKYMAVSREDIKRVANQYLGKDRVILNYVPKETKE